MSDPSFYLHCHSRLLDGCLYVSSVEAYCISFTDEISAALELTKKEWNKHKSDLLSIPFFYDFHLIPVDSADLPAHIAALFEH